jgi:hypothetical protein
MSFVDNHTGGGAMKCDGCGRFFRYKEPGSSWVFVPSSDAPSYEESVDWCAACTEKHGRPRPRQRVRVEMCSGVYDATENRDDD